ncbi:WG repeat-containing protein [Micromonospora sp. NPDC004551]|uniref:WG repeat-containing protein n=1 Tax=Micromonospora sp. NPDC004551 TaxID=3154284 RepID=UPI0033A27E8B
MPVSEPPVHGVPHSEPTPATQGSITAGRPADVETPAQAAAGNVPVARTPHSPAGADAPAAMIQEGRPAAVGPAPRAPEQAGVPKRTAPAPDDAAAPTAASHGTAATPREPTTTTNQPRPVTPAQTQEPAPATTVGDAPSTAATTGPSGEEAADHETADQHTADQHTADHEAIDPDAASHETADRTVAEDAGNDEQEARPADPEQALAAVRWRLHPETLREEAPDPAALRQIRDGLTAKLAGAVDNRSRARLLSLRSVASRVLGEFDDALADARLALTYAEATGELRRTALARARLAEVLRWRGEHAEADRLFAEANSPELPDRLRALLHEHAGRSCYDQGRLTEACLHFERALDLRQGEDGELNARTTLALDAVAERAAVGGFGPKPRSREELLGSAQHPVPTFDEDQELWGYADAEGELVIAHRYAEVQPFREGLAWVRRPEASRWALIDTTGAALIEANNGYRAVGSFSEGLAWVSMDGKGRWMAVDPTNIVKIPPGYEDVRPFRGGLAAVRQNGGWGAVDRTGQVVVPTRYHGLTTALADGRQVDGFTEDGLAGVELAGRRGVVDRTGRVVVTPAYPVLVVHPVAFLVADESGRWGALDRRGDPLIDPVHPDRAGVVAEIDRLLADASPVL